MVLFFLAAAILVIALVAILLLTLFSRSSNDNVNLLENNIGIARQKKSELQKALDIGAIDEPTFNVELATVEQRLATELATNPSNKDRSGSNIVGAIVICAFVPVAAGALYLKLGTPAALTGEIPLQSAAPQAATTSTEAPDLATVIPQLEAKLEAAPDDINGWKLLGRSYLMMGNPPQAEVALKKAITHGHEDADIWSLLAEANAMQKDGDLRGEPTELLEKAIAEDGIHERSYLLLGVARQQVGEHEKAIALFTELLANGERGDEATSLIQKMIAASESELGISSNPEDIPPPGTPGKQLTVNVAVSNAALAQIESDQAVFIYATATDGPPMPLAVSRHTVKDLPVTVTLDDSMAMVPDLNLSNFQSVTVGARISQTGNAIAQSGDWFGELTDIQPAETTNVEISINRQKP